MVELVAGPRGSGRTEKLVAWAMHRPWDPFLLEYEARVIIVTSRDQQRLLLREYDLGPWQVQTIESFRQWHLGPHMHHVKVAVDNADTILAGLLGGVMPDVISVEASPAQRTSSRPVKAASG